MHMPLQLSAGNHSRQETTQRGLAVHHSLSSTKECETNLWLLFRRPSWTSCKNMPIFQSKCSPTSIMGGTSGSYFPKIRHLAQKQWIYPINTCACTWWPIQLGQYYLEICCWNASITWDSNKIGPNALSSGSRDSICQWTHHGITWKFSYKEGCKMQELPGQWDPDIQLTAHSDLDIKYKIQCIATSKGIHTLGICLAPNSNDHDEFDYQLKQATNIKQCLSKALLGQEHVNIGFQSIWQAMIQYPLRATCFTAKQCQKSKQNTFQCFFNAWASIKQWWQPSGMDLCTLGVLMCSIWKWNRESWKQNLFFLTYARMMKLEKC